MKNILRKTLYIILMVTMIITSFTPYNTKAFRSQVTDSGGTNNKNTNGIYDGVKVSKTITESDLENYFNIKLTVETESEVSKITVPPSDISIVLVVDTSGSMDYCMNSSKTCNDGNTRLDNLKKALKGTNNTKGFLDYFIESAEEARKHDPDVIRELALVSFAGKKSTQITQVKRTDYTNNETSYKKKFTDKINDLRADGGTNPAPALETAGSILSESDASNKYIIYLTDGYPTQYYTNNGVGGHGDYYDDHSAYLVQQAANANKAKGIKTYTIGVGVYGQDTYTGTSKNNVYNGNITPYNNASTFVVGYGEIKPFEFKSPSELVGKPIVIADDNNNNSKALASDGNNSYKNINLNNSDISSGMWNLIQVNDGYKIYNIANNKYLGHNNDNQITFTDENNATIFTIDKNNNSSSYQVYYKQSNTKYYLRYDNWYKTGWGYSTNDFYASLYFGQKIENQVTGYTVGPKQFENWLSGNAKHGDENTNIGIGYVTQGSAYYDVSDSEGLTAAYNGIFASIEEEIERIASAWVVSDPMNINDGVTTGKYIEFDSFLNPDGTKIITNGDRLLKRTNSLMDNNIENTFEFENDNISWNLRTSDYVSTTSSGNKTYYTYELNYRVRLTNESEGFIENKDYNTNGSATLDYVLVVNGQAGDIETINFPNPKVKGYLGKFEFNKISDYYTNELNEAKKLNGAKFELSFDTNSEFNQVYLNEYAKVDFSKKYTATSDENGKVSFTNIPSGYEYILKEVEAPVGYELDNTTYKVSVKDNIESVDIPNTGITNTILYNNLVVKKFINSKAYINEDEEFEFEIVLENDNPNVKKYSYTKNDNTGNIVINNHKGTFKLKHNETIKISLPYGIKYTINEINITNYNETYDSNRSQVLNEDLTTVVTNTKKPTEVKVKKVWENIKDYASIPKVEVTLQRSLDNKTWEDAKDNKGNVLKATIDTSVKDYAEWNNLDGDYAYRVVETNVIGEDKEVYTIDYKYDDKSGTWTITNTDNRIAVLPEAGSSGGLILASLAFVFITMPVMYTAYNLYIEKRWF